MNHFDGITPEQLWKNDLLNELRENNRLLRELTQLKEVKKPDIPVQKRNYQRKDRKGVS
jgi:hypothetical protein